MVDTTEGIDDRGLSFSNDDRRTSAWVLRCCERIVPLDSSGCAAMRSSSSGIGYV